MDEYRLMLQKSNGMNAAKQLRDKVTAIIGDTVVSETLYYDSATKYAPEYVAKLEVRSKSPEPRVLTHIKPIDEILFTGLVPGRLTLFTGDVGGQKSNIMLNVGINVWKLSGKNVLFVPLEMDRESMFQRMCSRECNIPSERLAIPSLLIESEWKKLREFYKQWETLPQQFYIMESSRRIPVSIIRREIEKHLDIFKPHLVVIDYIANLTPEARYEDERNDLQIGEMLKDLRTMGKPGALTQEGFHIISAAQIGREALKRIRRGNSNKIGFYSEDIRGSHEYGADADTVFAQMVEENNRTRLSLYCIKNRSGPNIFASGRPKATLEIRGEISLVRSMDTNWLSTDQASSSVLDKVNTSLNQSLENMLQSDTTQSQPTDSGDDIDLILTKGSTKNASGK
jgi:replicative DNA helicase